MTYSDARGSEAAGGERGQAGGGAVRRGGSAPAVEAEGRELAVVGRLVGSDVGHEDLPRARTASDTRRM